MRRIGLRFAGLTSFMMIVGLSDSFASGVLYSGTNTAKHEVSVNPNTPQLMQLRVNPSYDSYPASARLARIFGYEVSTHSVITDDGYILSLTRIRTKTAHGNRTNAYRIVRPAVLLLHALETTTVTWVGLGPGKAYALKLADAGFDVWLGDFRGVPSSQKHTKLNPGSAEYWSFTMNEHGRHDIKAFVEKVRRSSGQSRILVSTYCMSSPAFLIYCHYHPEDCRTKIRGAVLTGSFLDLKSVRSGSFRTVLDTLSNPKDSLFDRFDRLGYVLFSPERLNGLPWEIAEQLYAYNMRPPSLKTLAMHDIEFSRTHPEVIARVWPEYVLQWPLVAFRSFVDTSKSGIFRGLDRGRDENMKRYGSERPPVYDLKRTTMPVFLIYSDAATVGSPEENRKIARGIARLPKELVLRNMNFTHLEVIFSDRAAELIYDPAINWLQDLLRKDPKYAATVRRETTIRRSSPAPPLAKTLAESFGYTAKKYRVVTTDGYILTMVRIGPKDAKNFTDPNYTKNRPAVLVLHGLTTSSGVWLGLGPKKAYALTLVDSGFDVWLGNLRGTPSSQEHKLLDPKGPVYWRFSLHEHALDLAVFVDSIRHITKRSKILYTGLSMASTILFIYCHIDPTACRTKISAAFLLAPILDMSTHRAGFLKDVSDLLENPKAPLINLLDQLGYVQFPPESPERLPKKLADLARSASSKELSKETLAAFEVPPETRKEVLARVRPEFALRWALDTYRFLLHTRKTGVLQGLDWGTPGNIERYKQKTPPVYDLKRTAMPVYLVYSSGDNIGSPEETRRISGAVPNLARVAEVSNFTHTGYYLSDRATRIYSIVIRWMKIFDKGMIQYGTAGQG